MEIDLVRTLEKQEIEIVNKLQSALLLLKTLIVPVSI